MDKLAKNMKIWEQILNNPRRTKIKDEITEIKLDMSEMVPKENVVVVITNEGYIKRVSSKSYAANMEEETTLKPGDFVTGLYEVSTQDVILFFTNLGNYLYIPVHKIPEAKWKELGKHINNIIPLSTDEEIIKSIVMKGNNKEIITTTKLGMVKKSLMKDYEVSRYSKPMTAIKLKENDEVVDVYLKQDNIIIVSQNGYYVNFKENEIPLTGVRSSGVKGINLKDDYVVSASSFNDEDYLDVFTNHNTAKRIKMTDLTYTGRAKKGNSLIKKVKSTDYKIVKAIPLNTKDIILVKSDSQVKELKNSDVSIMDTVSTGMMITKHKVDAIEKKPSFKTYLNDTPEKIEELTIDNFIEDFKI